MTRAQRLAHARMVAARLTGAGIWWRTRDRESSGASTLWYWDGRKGWHTSPEQHWELFQSRFEPSRMDCGNLYERCFPLPDGST